MVNVELLRKELEYITAFPEEHQQKDWLVMNRENVCGTAGCLAGNAALHAGRVVGYTAVTEKLTIWRPENWETYPPYNMDRAWTAIGKELFDISDAQAITLFGPYNSLRRLWEIAREITHGEIEVPIELPDE